MNENIETETWLTNGKGGHKKNQTWPVTLMDGATENAGTLISVLPYLGQCQMGYLRRKEKP